MGRETGDTSPSHPPLTQPRQPPVAAATPANAVYEAASQRLRLKLNLAASPRGRTHADGDVFEGRGSAEEAAGCSWAIISSAAGRQTADALV